MLYQKEEKKIFEKIKASCIGDLKIWNIVNIGFPLFTLIISIITLSYATKSFGKSILTVILGGGIPLISINLLVATSLFLIKFDKAKEKAFGLDTNNTRLKLIIYAFFSYLTSSAIFVIQTTYSPFTTFWSILIQILITILTVVFARNISSRLFLLQEDMIDKSYGEGILDNASKLKNVIQ
jgi:hypothetical protein